MKLRQIHEAQQKIEIASAILNKLPGWFGIPEATEEYIRHSSNMPFLVTYLGSKAVGFVAIKENNQYTAEIYVMGVDPSYHGQGIGKSLVNGVKDWW